MYKKQNLEETDVMLGVNDDEGTIFANTLIAGNTNHSNNYLQKRTQNTAILYSVF